MMNFTTADVAHFSQSFGPLVRDPNAKRSLHFQAGSFYWSDEMPEFVEDGYPASIKQFVVYLLSYRTVLMYGETVPKFTPLWDRLRECCPDWPGFRVERRSPGLIGPLEDEVNEGWDYLERVLDVRKRRTEHRRRMNERSGPRSEGPEGAA